MWKVKYPSGVEKGPMPTKTLFELIESGFIPVDSVFMSTEINKWINMETILDIQFQNLESNVNTFVNKTSSSHNYPSTISSSFQHQEQNHTDVAHESQLYGSNNMKDSFYNNTNNSSPRKNNIYQEKSDVPHMVQCDEYGGIYETTQKFNGGEWKRIGYSKMPLECVAIHPLTHELIGIRKISRNGISRSLLVTLERDISNTKSSSIFPSTEISIRFSNVKYAQLNIKSLTYSTCMDDGECTLYGIAECNYGHELLGTDSICRINPKTKQVDLILATGCHDVDAIASPYELLGPQQDIAFLFWSRKLGLHEVHWFGNNRIELVTKETPSHYKRRRLTSLYFTQDGDLFGVSGNDVLPFGNMATEEEDVQTNNDSVEKWEDLGPEVYVAEVSDESSSPQQQHHHQQQINGMVVDKKMKKQKKNKKKKKKVNFVSNKTKNKGTQNNIDKSPPKLTSPVSSQKTSSSPSTTKTSVQPMYYQRQFEREDWEYFVMAERERRYQAEANAWSWMQHAYYARMEAQQQAYYHQQQQQQYLMRYHGQQPPSSPLALSQNQQAYTNHVPTIPANMFETTTINNTYNPMQNTTINNRNDLKVDEYYLAEEEDSLHAPEVESDDVADENKSFPNTPSVVGRNEPPVDATSNNRRGSMLRNKKMRRQTSVGSLLVHEQGTDKFGGGKPSQSTYYESFHDFSAPNQNNNQSGNKHLVSRYLLLGSAAHRGSISGGSMHTRIGQLYLSNSDDFNDMTKIGKSVPNLNALASSSNGQVFGVSNSDILLKIDPNTGNTLTLGALKFYDKRHDYSFDIDIVDITFGRWLDGCDTLYGLMKCSPDVLGLYSDAIVSIDIHSGKCTLVAETHRRGVTSFASPPLEGGPWGGTIFYFWVEKQGLFDMKWANRQFSIGNVIAGSQTQFNIRSLIFNLNNVLIGWGSSMYEIIPQQRKIKRLKALPLTSLKVIILRYESQDNSDITTHRRFSQKTGLEELIVDEVVTDTEEYFI